MLQEHKIKAMNPTPKSSASLAQILQDAAAFDMLMTRNLFDSVYPADLRTRTAGASFHTSLEHFSGIRVLCGVGKFAPAFALLRVQWDAFLNGAWLLHCAKPDRLKRIFDRRDGFPKIELRVRQLVTANEAYRDGGLASLFSAIEKGLHDLTHAGVGQIVHTLGPEHIESQYTAEQAAEGLSHSMTLGLLSLSELASLSDSEKVLDGVEAFLQKSARHGTNVAGRQIPNPIQENPNIGA